MVEAKEFEPSTPSSPSFGLDFEVRHKCRELGRKVQVASGFISGLFIEKIISGVSNFDRRLSFNFSRGLVVKLEAKFRIRGQQA